MWGVEPHSKISPQKYLFICLVCFWYTSYFCLNKQIDATAWYLYIQLTLLIRITQSTSAFDEPLSCLPINI